MKEQKENPILARFSNFVRLVWQHLGLPEPTPVQVNLCDMLQATYERNTRRLVIEAFRGVGKSWLTSAFVCWLLLKNEQLKILVVSASKIRADDFSTFCFRLINELPVLQHLRPKEDQRNSKISWDVGPALPDHAPSVKSIGITGQLAGSRADFIIADDVEVPTNSATPAMREKLSEAVKEFDAIIKPGGRVLYLGTPQTEESLYNKLPDRGYKARIWPARIPGPKQVESYGNKLAPYILDQISRGAKPGDPVDPRRFDNQDLLEREASYGRSGFQLQFMLDTKLSDADRYPLRLSDLMVLPLDPRRAPVQLAWASGKELVVDVPTVSFSGDRFYRPGWLAKIKDSNQEDTPFTQYAEYTGSLMFIDPSGRGKDECAYAVVKNLYGTLFLTASGGFLTGYSEETLRALAVIAHTQNVKLIQVEANFGDGMFTQLLKPVLNKIHPVMIEEVKHSVQKEKRIIDTLEPVVNSHRLVVSEDVIRKDWDSIQSYGQDERLQYSLFYQYTRITREKGALVRDDRLDSLAGAVNYWVESMAKDSSKTQAEDTAKLLDKDLEKFVQHAMGRSRHIQERSWINSTGIRR